MNKKISYLFFGKFWHFIIAGPIFIGFLSAILYGINIIHPSYTWTYYYVVMITSGIYIFGLLFLHILGSEKSKKKTLMSLLFFFPLMCFSYFIINFFVAASIDPIRIDYYQSEFKNNCLNAVNNIKERKSFETAYKIYQAKENSISSELKLAKLKYNKFSPSVTKIEIDTNNYVLDDPIYKKNYSVHRMDSGSPTDEACSILKNVGFHLAEYGEDSLMKIRKIEATAK